MMKHPKSLLAASALLTFAAAALTGCADEPAATDSARQELRLTSAIEAASRGDIQSSAIVEGETLHAWVTDASTGEALYNAVTLTAGANGALTSSTAMYFPQSGNAVTVSALHGTLTEAPTPGTTALPTALGFKVAADQRAEADYVASDLLYVRQTVKRSTQAAELTFHHMLSKIELQITKGAGVTDEVVAVTLDDVALSGTLDTSAATITAGTTRGPIALSTAYGGEDEVTNDAIVVPQSVSKKTMTFTLASGGKLVYTFPENAAFSSGVCTFYNVTLNLTGLTVSSSIEPWTDGEGGSGAGSLPTPPQVGEWLLSTGSFVARDMAGEWQKKLVVGVVFSTDPVRVMSVKLVAQAETDAAVWSTVEEQLGSAYYDSIYAAELAYVKAWGDMDGLTPSKNAFNKTAGLYPAFDAVKALAAPSGTTGWYIPSAGEVKLLLETLCGQTDWSGGNSGSFYSATKSTPFADRLNAYLEGIPSDKVDAFGDTISFATTTERSASSYWPWELSKQAEDSYDIYFGDKPKSGRFGTYDVRPILQF